MTDPTAIWRWISHFSSLFNSGSTYPLASVPGICIKKAGFDLEGFAKLSQRHDGEVVFVTLNATIIDLINASQRTKLSPGDR